MTIKNKRILLSSFLLFLIINSEPDYVIPDQYGIVKMDDGYCGKYRDGNIYIGKKAFLKSVDYQEGDILVEDQRNNVSNPNMRIYFSYKIRDDECRSEIIDVLQHYEEMYPTIWERSSDSMKAEWLVHNFCYDVNYQRDRTANVDFNNKDEQLYNDKVLKKIINH